MPFGVRPFQVFTHDDVIRSTHSIGYTRLHDGELLDAVIEETCDFDAPPKDSNGAKGIDAGEQDIFAFLIDNKTNVSSDSHHPGRTGPPFHRRSHRLIALFLLRTLLRNSTHV